MRSAPPDRQRALPRLYVEAPLAGARREPGPWAVLTGPEGGFAAEEIAALACLQALAGDWRSG